MNDLDERELLGLWLSRRMFGGLVRAELGGRYVEDRSFEEYRDAYLAASVSAGGPATESDEP